MDRRRPPSRLPSNKPSSARRGRPTSVPVVDQNTRTLRARPATTSSARFKVTPKSTTLASDTSTTTARTTRSNNNVLRNQNHSSIHDAGLGNDISGQHRTVTAHLQEDDCLADDEESLCSNSYGSSGMQAIPDVWNWSQLGDTHIVDTEGSSNQVPRHRGNELNSYQTIDTLVEPELVEDVGYYIREDDAMNPKLQYTLGDINVPRYHGCELDNFSWVLFSHLSEPPRQDGPHPPLRLGFPLGQDPIHRKNYCIPTQPALPLYPENVGLSPHLSSPPSASFKIEAQSNVRTVPRHQTQHLSQLVPSSGVDEDSPRTLSTFFSPPTTSSTLSVNLYTPPSSFSHPSIPSLSSEGSMSSTFKDFDAEEDENVADDSMMEYLNLEDD